VTCEVPSPRWAEGFRRPLNAALCTGGVVCVPTATVVTDGWHGMLPLLGSLLFFLGSGNGVLRAHNLGSVLGLVNGARARLDMLTTECLEQRIRMRCLAEQLCADSASVERTIDLATVQVCRDWPRGTGHAFTVFLLCRTITIAEAQAAVYGGHVALDPGTDEERKVVRALHDLCGLDAEHIARILDRDTGQIDAVLAAAPPGSRP
jgi:hypothetical protein